MAAVACGGQHVLALLAGGLVLVVHAINLSPRRSLLIQEIKVKLVLTAVVVASPVLFSSRGTFGNRQFQFGEKTTGMLLRV